MDGTERVFFAAQLRFLPDDMLPALGGTRLLAVLTFGGMNLICLPSTVFKFPMPLMTIGFVEEVAVEGIPILIGLLRNGELMATFGGAVTVAEVVALLFSANAAAVSKSFPPPATRFS